MNSYLIDLSYILSACLFILGLKMLGHPSSARRGNSLSALGMLLAVAVTLFDKEILSYQWILTGMGVGIIAGGLLARTVAMTTMPEMVAFFNGLGGAASVLVGWEIYLRQEELSLLHAITITLSILIGAVTFSGSLIAWAKLAGVMKGKPFLFPFQQAVNIVLVMAIFICAGLFIENPSGEIHFYLLMGLSCLMGILSVIPIGGADMPVVISLLNSYSGLAAAAAGFAISNYLLIVAGSLVGASGIILTSIMCKAMNRSLANVLFSGFGAGTKKSDKITGKTNPISVQDCFYLLEAAGNVLIVPGYGLAVAQAQHVIRELQEILQNNDAEVSFAIHPVAGRMPGHMNVLLAEADISYDYLMEMDTVNPVMETMDIVMVIGANDVVNPSAKEDSASPLYGMPVIEVTKAKTVIVLKRSMSTGFSGVENPLFFKENTRMLFGDAKDSIQKLLTEFKN